MNFLVFLIVSMIFAVYAVDLEKAKETPCFDVTNKTVPLDLNWVGTIKTLFYPYMSRYDLYTSALQLTGKSAKNLGEANIYYDSCTHWSMYPNGTIISRGFDGLSLPYNTQMLTPNLEQFLISPELQGNKEVIYAGHKYTTLSDNKTFLFTPFCTKDGQMTWGVGSITPTLDKDTVRQIHEHAESLGFKREFFTQLRYDGCKNLPSS